MIDENGDLVLTYQCNLRETPVNAYVDEKNVTLAPEIYSFQCITKAVDWWSFGVILYELLVQLVSQIVGLV